MLIISRKAGESFLIGENIEITLFEIKGDKVRIGIDAPSHIPILRKEIKETVDENTHASENSATETLQTLLQYIKQQKN